MLNNLFRRLSGDAGRSPDDPEARIALAALLVRIARADGFYDPHEVERIDRILMRRFQMSPFEATALRTKGEAAEASAPDTVRFTREVKAAVPYEERLGVIEQLWEVVLADGERDHEEDSLMRLIAPMLGVEDQDSHRARQRAAARQG